MRQTLRFVAILSSLLFSGEVKSFTCVVVLTDPFILTGDRVGVDVNALYKQQDFVKYSVTMTSYGYYGDLLADSEKLRWMGPKRYNWSGNFFF